MADITEDQQRAAEKVVAEALPPILTDILANATAALDTDTSIIIAHAINTYLEATSRMGKRSRLTAADVTRLFTIINLYLEGGTVKLQGKEDFAPKGRPQR